jgi:hypothetical protein
MLQAKRERIVVVSHSTKCLDVIQKTLVDRGFENVRLEGSTSTSKRVQMVDRLVQYLSFAFGSRSFLFRLPPPFNFMALPIATPLCILANLYVAFGRKRGCVDKQNAQSQVQRPKVQIVCDATEFESWRGWSQHYRGITVGYAPFPSILAVLLVVVVPQTLSYKFCCNLAPFSIVLLRNFGPPS